ncbi:hypothetical protein [Tomitella fengzijianii]|uniref:Uncharacterized protein n=1 Tax=Tomitella fengzijianii TaxID=2597660 RepID=A0A516X6I6_9ACTN|nr:hypothetical protein [Tomitella fengzijianii]QDQ98682.1 hypothetical protein FO059_16805 [Tomitella fengzijianii]
MSRRSANGSGGGWIIVFLALAVVGFIITYIVAISIMVGVVAVSWLVYWLIDRRVKARRAREAGAQAERAALASRAMRQHEAVLRGDPRGIYGAYLPAVFPEFGPAAMRRERPVPRLAMGRVPEAPPRRVVEPKGIPIQRTARPPGRRPAA